MVLRNKVIIQRNQRFSGKFETALQEFAKLFSDYAGANFNGTPWEVRICIEDTKFSIQFPDPWDPTGFWVDEPAKEMSEFDPKRLLDEYKEHVRIETSKRRVS